MTQRQRILAETIQTRADAEALLRELLRAKEAVERHQAELKLTDPLRRVTGRSSLDNAISSAQRMIETLNRQLETVRRDLREEDLASAYLPEAGR